MSNYGREQVATTKRAGAASDHSQRLNGADHPGKDSHFILSGMVVSIPGPRGDTNADGVVNIDDLNSVWYNLKKRIGSSV